ncbi:MAG TPA: lipocalin-like domain-containing protein [Acidisphaera sp.]|nr:lipocalin-like domain-containing protein [Acidisphaera sp.]
MTRIAVAFVAALLALASTSGQATAQQPTIQSQIVGTWRTVSVTVERGTHGKVDLFHGHVNGMAVFTGDGHFMQVFTQNDTPKIATGNRQTLTPDEAVAIERQSYAVFGTYTVSEPGRAYTVHIIGSTFPNEVGSDEVRRVTFSGDEMTFVNPKASAGKDVTVTLRRVK